MRTRPITPLAASLLAASLLLGACNKPTPPPAQANPQNQLQATPNQTAANNPNPNNPNQGTLNSDGTSNPPNAAALNPQTGQQPYPAQNQAQVQPQSPENAQPAPPNAPPAPAPPRPALIVPSGAQVTVRVTESLSASHNEVGDSFNGTLDEPLVSHGKVVFPRGTPVAGTVIAAKGRGRFKGAGALGIELTRIGNVRVHTTEYEQEEKGRGKRSAGLIGGGAGLGAIIGGIAGGGKGAAIGGLAGAGAGTAGAAYTGKRDVVIPSESRVTFRLTEPIRR
ncbi:MAG TPA: hypothetical protein VNW54_12100 [Granulicella sp.]|nr:hypothetical protein [Granulicella sp.]